MKRRRLRGLAAGPLLMGLCLAPGAAAQQSGGVLKVGHFDSPASMSMLEESTVAVNRPMMGVFNNLVVFKQDEPQNTFDLVQGRSRILVLKVKPRRVQLEPDEKSAVVGFTSLIAASKCLRASGVGSSPARLSSMARSIAVSTRLSRSAPEKPEVPAA